MRVRVRTILLNVFLYVLLALLWGVILSIVFLLTTVDSFLDYFEDGILLKIFAITSILGLIITVVFHKKMKYKWMLPAFLIMSTIITTIVNYGIFYSARDYMSVYTREKWDNYPMVRYCMIDDLKERYELVGMTEQELKEILGEPTFVTEYTGNTKYKGYTTYQYMIGDDKIDGYTYDFIFEKGIVIDTAVSQT